MEDKNQQLPNTRISWYPGHMAKTKKQIIEDLKLIDIIVEILDARIPIASKNPDLEKWIEGKQYLQWHPHTFLGERQERQEKLFFLKSERIMYMRE